MELRHEQLAVVKGDAVLVKRLTGPDKIGSIHVPEVARDGHSGVRRSWRAEVVMLGEGVDKESFLPYTIAVGDIVHVAPAAIDCPGFQDEADGSHYIFVRDEDLLAKEVADA